MCNAATDPPVARMQATGLLFSSGTSSGAGVELGEASKRRTGGPEGVYVPERLGAYAKWDAERCLPCCSLTEGQVREFFLKVESVLKHPWTFRIGSLTFIPAYIVFNAVGIAFFITLENIQSSERNVSNPRESGKCDLAGDLKEGGISLGVEMLLLLPFMFFYGVRNIILKTNATRTVECLSPVKGFVLDLMPWLGAIVGSFVSDTARRIQAGECYKDYNMPSFYASVLPIFGSLMVAANFILVMHSFVLNLGLVSRREEAREPLLD